MNNEFNGYQALTFCEDHYEVCNRDCQECDKSQYNIKVEVEKEKK